MRTPSRYVNKRPAWFGPSYRQNIRVRYITPDDVDEATFDDTSITFDSINRTFDED